MFQSGISGNTRGMRPDPACPEVTRHQSKLRVFAFLREKRSGF